MCVRELGWNFSSNKVQRTKRNLKTVYVVKVSDFDGSNVEMVGFSELYRYRTKTAA